MYTVIYNPTAHHGKSGFIVDKITKRLTECHLEYSVRSTERVGHAKEIAQEVTTACPTANLLVVGGDGTIHEVLNGIAFPESVKVAFFSGGTGNDFYAAAYGDTPVENVLEKVVRDETTPIDYLEVNGIRCMNAGGLGIDVDVLNRFAAGKKHDKINYFYSFVSSVFHFRGYAVHLSVNGDELDENVLFAEACNGYRIGGGIVICPGAKVDDGKMELVVVPQVNVVRLVRTFIAVLRKKIFSQKTTRHYFCDELTIIPNEPQPIQLDGEIYQDCKKFHAVVKHGLKVYR